MATLGDPTKPPFRRVLVANRGEIALRVIRACHELGCEAVAVYSDADVDAPHVRAADVAVRIGPPAAEASYLCIDEILQAARETGAEAIHPGYGFLSESPDFAEACEAAGIVFVGPSATTIATLGNKLAARRAASAVGVPVTPGTLEPICVADLQAAESASSDAERVGWPLMVKAVAGGGGRGMRRVDRPEDLPSALLVASQEARAAFGDGAVYLERYLPHARHVEVQLLGDAAGNVAVLGERDCSVQRRHQKLVEEAPAPGLAPARCREIHDMAATLARHFGLRNAATAEFLLDSDGSFWFMEMNTRLQVEHGVTELVTGIDLVHEQLRIAAGEPLSSVVLATAAEIGPRRHAIEVRISAEDPGRAFAPVAGRIERWRVPSGPGVRVDSGVEEGSLVSTHYDPLLAKLMVVAEDRRTAIGRLRRALDEFEIAGVQTTLPFLRWIARDNAFVAGELSTTFVPDRWHPEPLRRASAARAASLVAAWSARMKSTAATFGRSGGETPSAGRAPTSPWLVQGRREAVDRWPG